MAKTPIRYNVRTGYLIAVLLVMLGYTGIAQDGYGARVTGVVDGNTIEIVSAENGKQKVVLFGIDCPELGQAFGEEAKEFVAKRLMNKVVEVVSKGKDRFGNYLGMVILGSKDVRVDLLKEGLAWTVETNPPQDLVPYMAWAQMKGRGLWKLEKPVPPWVYRRERTRSQPKSS